MYYNIVRISVHFFGELLVDFGCNWAPEAPVRFLLMETVSRSQYYYVFCVSFCWAAGSSVDTARAAQFSIGIFENENLPRQKYEATPQLASDWRKGASQLRRFLNTCSPRIKNKLSSPLRGYPSF